MQRRRPSQKKRTVKKSHPKSKRQARAMTMRCACC